MCIYTYLELVFLCMLLIELLFPTKQIKNLFFLISSILLIVLLGFRSNIVGGDTENYVKMFMGESGPYGTLDKPIDDIEHGIYYVAWFVKLFVDDYWAFLLFTGIITLAPFLYCIKKYSIIVSLPFILYMSSNWNFLYLNLIAMRQNIAVACFMSAVLIWIKYKFTKKYTILSLCFISLLFHRSIIIAMIAFVIMNFINIKKKNAIIILLISIVGGIMIEKMLYDVVQTINILSNTAATDRFADYDESSFTSNVNFNRLAPSTLFVITMLLCSYKDDLYDIRLKFLVAGCVLFNLTASISVAMRLVYPLTFVGITYVPTTIYNKNFIIHKLLIFLIMLFFFWGNLKKFDGHDNLDGIYPYTFVWE